MLIRMLFFFNSKAKLCSKPCMKHVISTYLFLLYFNNIVYLLFLCLSMLSIPEMELFTDKFSKVECSYSQVILFI